MSEAALARFGADYAAHRAAEGRNHSGDDLCALPYLTHGPLARQWSVRARSFDSFLAHVLRPYAKQVGRPLRLLDLGAGNAWLCHRVAQEGHSAVAVDIRDDDIDGLGAAEFLAARSPGRIELVKASFESLPIESGSADIAVFNASLHYALDLQRAIGEATRAVRPGGRLVILDSPFYLRDQDGAAMVAEKRAQAETRFGGRADALLALPFIEYLTRNRLASASVSPALHWTRHRVRYPLWYEFRPLLAALRGRRRPSRFDLWVARRP